MLQHNRRSVVNSAFINFLIVAVSIIPTFAVAVCNAPMIGIMPKGIKRHNPKQLATIFRATAAANASKHTTEFTAI